MRNFFKDYAELCKETGRFYKKHWKGCIVMNAVILGAEAGWLFRGQINDKIEEIRNSK